MMVFPFSSIAFLSTSVFFCDAIVAGSVFCGCLGVWCGRKKNSVGKDANSKKLKNTSKKHEQRVEFSCLQKKSDALLFSQ